MSFYEYSNRYNLIQSPSPSFLYLFIEVRTIYKKVGMNFRLLLCNRADLLCKVIEKKLFRKLCRFIYINFILIFFRMEREDLIAQY